MRQRLLEEEVRELAEAVQTGRLDAIAQELADVVYVAYGTALAYGIDLDQVLAEIHRANLTKLDHDGHPLRRDDGKILRSHRYQPPDVAEVLRRQGWAEHDQEDSVPVPARTDMPRAAEFPE